MTRFGLFQLLYMSSSDPTIPLKQSLDYLMSSRVMAALQIIDVMHASDAKRDGVTRLVGGPRLG